MTKSEIYQEIKDFNETPYDSGRRNSDPRHKVYLYVTQAVANERAEFFKYLLAENEGLQKAIKKMPTVLDLAFGSGSLTTHLLQDVFPDYEGVILNDKNTENTFQEITNILPNSEIKTNDFLKSEEFDKEKADIIIFNPQTGGGYTEGDSGLKDYPESIIFGGSFSDYLRSKGIAVNDLVIDESTDREIHVESTGSLKDIEAVLKGIQIFNYQDVFYKSKNSQEKGNVSNNVLFRRTFDKKFTADGLLIFYGDKKLFDALFADFKCVVQYRSKDLEGNDLFVALKKPSDTEKQEFCYKRDGNGFVEIPNCVEEEQELGIDGDLNDLENQIEGFMQTLNLSTKEDAIFSQAEKTPSMPEKQEETFEFLIPDDDDFPNFEYRNILLKGVPGTGKSRLINESFIKKELGLELNSPNVLRVNVHSASSNSDLMQGIGIRANESGNVEYKEKTGLVLRHLKNALRSPFEPFVIVLEEIQENSLNELIGDLIYLIEADKRVNLRERLSSDTLEGKKLKVKYAGGEAEFLKDLCQDESVFYVERPYLVSDKTEYQLMILPDNLYFFCTSNYRDDKKVIEDNLLRRFEVIEIYPKNKAAISGDAFKNQDVSDFLEKLNTTILNVMQDKEIHPDRFMIGHAIWLNVEDEKSFCRAFLRVVTEFKDVKEVEFDEFKEILSEVKSVYPFGLDESQISHKSYQELIFSLQKIAYSGILDV